MECTGLSCAEYSKDPGASISLPQGSLPQCEHPPPPTGIPVSRRAVSLGGQCAWIDFSTPVLRVKTQNVKSAWDLGTRLFWVCPAGGRELILYLCSVVCLRSVLSASPDWKWFAGKNYGAV